MTISVGAARQTQTFREENRRRAVLGLHERQRINQRINILYNSLPDFTADPDVMVGLATSELDDTAMVEAAINTAGDSFIMDQKDFLDELPDEVAEARYNLMSDGMQTTMRGVGYTPYSETQDNSSWYDPQNITGYIAGDFRVPLVGRVGAMSNWWVRNLDITGSIEDGPFWTEDPTFGGVVGAAASSATWPLRLPFLGAKQALHGVFWGFEASMRLTQRIWRTGYILSDRDTFIGLDEAGNPQYRGRFGLPEVPSRITKSPLLEPLNYGAYSLITDPGSVLDAWKVGERGEETFQLGAIHTAADLLASNPDQFTVEGSDLWLAKKIAGGQTEVDILDELGIPNDDPAYIETVQRIYDKLQDKSFNKALDVLNGAKFSYGREVARQIGLDTNSGMGKVISGTGDALFVIVVDPINLLGGHALKVNKARRWKLAANGFEHADQITVYQEAADHVRHLDDLAKRGGVADPPPAPTTATDDAAKSVMDEVEIEAEITRKVVDEAEVAVKEASDELTRDLGNDLIDGQTKVSEQILASAKEDLVRAQQGAVADAAHQADEAVLHHEAFLETYQRDAWELRSKIDEINEQQLNSSENLTEGLEYNTMLGDLAELETMRIPETEDLLESAKNIAAKARSKYDKELVTAEKAVATAAEDVKKAALSAGRQRAKVKLEANRAKTAAKAASETPTAAGEVAPATAAVSAKTRALADEVLAFLEKEGHTAEDLTNQIDRVEAHIHFLKTTEVADPVKRAANAAELEKAEDILSKMKNYAYELNKPKAPKASTPEELANFAEESRRVRIQELQKSAAALDRPLGRMRNNLARLEERLTELGKITDPSDVDIYKMQELEKKIRKATAHVKRVEHQQNRMHGTARSISMHREVVAEAKRFAENLKNFDIKQARRTNQWVDRISKGFKAINEADPKDAPGILAQFIDENPALQGVWEQMWEWHVAVRSAGGDGLESSKGVWAYLKTERGRMGISNTKLGGVRPDIREIPQHTAFNQGVSDIKQFGRRALDPSKKHLRGEARDFKFVKDINETLAKINYAMANGTLEQEYQSLIDQLRSVAIKFTDDGKPVSADMDELLNWRMGSSGTIAATRRLVRGMFIHAHTAKNIPLDDIHTIKQFREIAESGVLAHMPQKHINEWIGRFALGNESERALILQQFWHDLVYRTGITSHADLGADTTLHKILSRTQQSYSIGGRDAALNAGLRTKVAISASEQIDDVIMTPVFKEVARATIQINVHRMLFQAMNPNWFDARIVGIWAPLQLARIGFIPRAAGEEILAYMLRRNPGELIRSKAAISAGEYRRARDGSVVAWNEGREATFLRPVLWFQDSVGRWSGVRGSSKSGIYTKFDRQAHAAAMSDPTWTSLHPKAQEALVKAKGDEIREAHKFRVALSNWEGMQDLSSGLADAMVAVFAHVPGIPSKRQMAIWLSNWGAEEITSPLLRAQGIKTTGDLRRAAADMMLTDPRMARGFADFIGASYSPYHNVTDDIQRGKRAIGSIASTREAKILPVRVDPSKFRTYSRPNDAKEFLSNYSAILNRFTADRHMMRGVRVLNNYASEGSRIRIARFFEGLIDDAGEADGSVLNQVRAIWNNIGPRERAAVKKYIDGDITLEAAKAHLIIPPKQSIDALEDTRDVRKDVFRLDEYRGGDRIEGTGTVPTVDLGGSMPDDIPAHIVPEMRKFFKAFNKLRHDDRVAVIEAIKNIKRAPRERFTPGSGHSMPPDEFERVKDGLQVAGRSNVEEELKRFVDDVKSKGQGDYDEALNLLIKEWYPEGNFGKRSAGSFSDSPLNQWITADYASLKALEKYTSGEYTAFQAKKASGWTANPPAGAEKFPDPLDEVRRIRAQLGHEVTERVAKSRAKPPPEPKAVTGTGGIGNLIDHLERIRTRLNAEGAPKVASTKAAAEQVDAARGQLGMAHGPMAALRQQEAAAAVAGTGDEMVKKIGMMLKRGHAPVAGTDARRAQKFFAENNMALKDVRKLVKEVEGGNLGLFEGVLTTKTGKQLAAERQVLHRILEAKEDMSNRDWLLLSEHGNAESIEDLAELREAMRAAIETSLRQADSPAFTRSLRATLEEGGTLQRSPRKGQHFVYVPMIPAEELALLDNVTETAAAVFKQSLQKNLQELSYSYNEALQITNAVAAKLRPRGGQAAGGAADDLKAVHTYRKGSLNDPSNTAPLTVFAHSDYRVAKAIDSAWVSAMQPTRTGPRPYRIGMSEVPQGGMTEMELVEFGIENVIAGGMNLHRRRLMASEFEVMKHQDTETMLVLERIENDSIGWRADTGGGLIDNKGRVIDQQLHDMHPEQDIAPTKNPAAYRERAREELEALGPDDLVTVFHITDSETAQQMLRSKVATGNQIAERNGPDVIHVSITPEEAMKHGDTRPALADGVNPDDMAPEDAAVAKAEWWRWKQSDKRPKDTVVSFVVPKRHLMTRKTSRRTYTTEKTSSPPIDDELGEPVVTVVRTYRPTTKINDPADVFFGPRGEKGSGKPRSRKNRGDLSMGRVSVKSGFRIKQVRLMEPGAAAAERRTVRAKVTTTEVPSGFPEQVFPDGWQAQVESAMAGADPVHIQRARAEFDALGDNDIVTVYMRIDNQTAEAQVAGRQELPMRDATKENTPVYPTHEDAIAEGFTVYAVSIRKKHLVHNAKPDKVESVTGEILISDIHQTYILKGAKPVRGENLPGTGPIDERIAGLEEEIEEITKRLYRKGQERYDPSLDEAHLPGHPEWLNDDYLRGSPEATKARKKLFDRQKKAEEELKKLTENRKSVDDTAFIRMKQSTGNKRDEVTRRERVHDPEITDWENWKLADVIQGDGTPYDLAIAKMAEIQVEEILDTLSTVRRGNDEVFTELTSPMIAGDAERISPRGIMENAVMDDLPQHAYGPTVLGPEQYTPGNIWESFKRGMFDDIISPAVGSLSRQPMFVENLTRALERNIHLMEVLGPSEESLAIFDDIIAGLVKLGDGELEKLAPDDLVARLWDMDSSEFALVVDAEREGAVIGFLRAVKSKDAKLLKRWAKKELGKDPMTTGEAEQVITIMHHKRRAYEEMRDATFNETMTLTMPFIDDHRVRSQFQGHMSGIIPFWFAEEQFLKRWARGMYENPLMFRKAQLTLHGSRNMGFIQQDQYGNDVFVWPMSETVSTYVAEVVSISGVFGAPAMGVMSNPMSTNLDFILPGVSSDSPAGFQFGPGFAVQMNFVARHFPEFSDLRDDLLGDMSANRYDPGAAASETTLGYAYDLVAPGYFKNAVRAMVGNDSTQLASAQAQALQFLVANGYAPDEKDALDLERFLDQTRNTARIILAMRAVTSSTLGTATNPLYSGEAGQTFRRLLTEGAIDYPDAVDLIVQRYGGEATAFTVFGTESQSGAPIPSTEKSLAFMQDNGEFLNNFDMAGTWFLPQDRPEGEFGIVENRARNQALAHELRIKRSPEDTLRSIYVAAASEDYFNSQDVYETQRLALKAADASPETIRDMDHTWRLWKRGYLTQHPVFAEELSTPTAQVRRDRTITQARLLVANPDIVPEVAHKDELLELMEALISFKDAMNSIRGENSGLASQIRKEWRTDFFNNASFMVNEHPELSVFFNSVIRPEIGRKQIVEIENANAA